MNIAKWILSLTVGGLLILFGITKFTGGAHIFPLIELKATAIGFPMADLFFPLVNYLVGGLEVAAGVLVILPATRRAFGALLAVVPFFGAVLFHLSPLLGVVTPNGYAEGADGLSEALASGTGFETAHFTADAGPALFIIASLLLVLSAANAYLHKSA
ncbi:MAG: hypothetical protein AAF498_04355 [Pseudomonadota bacterium]